MRLWTIQHKPVFERLQRQGHFYADGRRIYRYFREPYRWLLEQYREHNPQHRGRKALIWAWQTPKPDLRASCHLEQGAEGVRLEIEVPNDQVLLSDFDGWHFRLNRHYLALSEKDDEDFQRRYGDILVKVMGGRRFQDMKVGEIQAILRDEVEASWSRMFDLPLMEAVFKRGRMIGPHHKQQVQAVFERLDLDQVKKATPFRSR